MQKADKKSRDYTRMRLQHKLNFDLCILTIESFLEELKEILEENKINQLDEMERNAIFFCLKKIEDHSKSGTNWFSDYLKMK